MRPGHWHTHTCAFTHPDSNGCTGTNPKQLYGSQLNPPSFLGKTEKTLARQIKLEMGQSQAPRSKTTQNSQCIWTQVQILTVCCCFSLSLCHLPGQDKLFTLSPSISWCIYSPSSTRDLHGSAHPCAPCGCLAHFLPRPSLTWEMFRKLMNKALPIPHFCFCAFPTHCPPGPAQLEMWI